MTIEHRPPTVSEYQQLRASTSWDQLPDKMVANALQHDLFAVCALEGSKTVGMGRVIGDGAIYYYIQDVIVLPAHQGRGIGKRIMELIEQYLATHAPPNAFIGLMAAKGVAGFYKSFGYQLRAPDAPGMYKRI